MSCPPPTTLHRPPTTSYFGCGAGRMVSKHGKFNPYAPYWFVSNVLLLTVTLVYNLVFLYAFLGVFVVILLSLREIADWNFMRKTRHRTEGGE